MSKNTQLTIHKHEQITQPQPTCLTPTLAHPTLLHAPHSPQSAPLVVGEQSLAEFQMRFVQSVFDVNADVTGSG